jgi:hypothetical protein
MSELDTAEYRKLALIAAGVPLNQIPPIIDTATWRRMLIAALVNSTANQVISGSVDYFSQLPTTIGSPAIGATWLVRNSSGIFYINYRSAGVYMKVTDTGSASDWVYIPMSAIGTLPDVTLTNPQVGQTITWNGTRWVNSNIPSSLIKVSETDRPNPLGGGYLDIATLQVEANTKYLIEAHYIYLSSGFGGGPWARILCPEGTTGGGSMPFVLNNTGSMSYYVNNNWVATPSSSLSNDASIGNTGAKGAGSINGFIKTGSLSGSVTMQMRPYTSGVNFTLYAGSFLKLEKYS